MGKKNYKKFLVDLFESQLKFNELDEEYLDGTYYPSLKFHSDLLNNETTLNNEDDDFTYTKSHHKNCLMVLLNKNENFYLSFNSIKTEISFTDYKRLNTLVLQKKEEQKERLKKLTYKRDEKLLNEVFSNFSKKQSRKTLIEKHDSKRSSDKVI